MASSQALLAILRDVKARKLTAAAAYHRLKHLPYDNLGSARIDHHRRIRKGIPEAVYAPGKSPKQLIRITKSFLDAGGPFLITRLEKSAWLGLSEHFPVLFYDDEAKAAWHAPGHPRVLKRKSAKIAIVTAGTSDIPVAREAEIALRVMGLKPVCYFDCGVAGLHRLADLLPQIRSARAVICIAGMDGALPSVLAGLVGRPVVAVPTSVGYGASFKGLAALLTMLNTCSQGVAVVNIDNGFGAACFAAMTV